MDNKYYKMYVCGDVDDKLKWCYVYNDERYIKFDFKHFKKLCYYKLFDMKYQNKHNINVFKFFMKKIQNMLKNKNVSYIVMIDTDYIGDGDENVVRFYDKNDKLITKIIMNCDGIYNEFTREQLIYFDYDFETYRYYGWEWDCDKKRKIDYMTFYW